MLIRLTPNAPVASVVTMANTQTSNQTLTADWITDLQICELRARAHGAYYTERNDSLIELCDIARSAHPTGRDPDGTIITRELARARCAAILNAWSKDCDCTVCAYAKKYPQTGARRCWERK